MFQNHDKEKKKNNEKEDKHGEAQKDFLNNFPLDVGQLILPYLNLHDLGTMCLVDKAHHQQVFSFLSQTHNLVGLFFKSRENPPLLNSFRPHVQKVLSKKGISEHESEGDKSKHEEKTTENRTSWDVLADCLSTDNVMLLIAMDKVEKLKEAIQTLSHRLSPENKEFFERQVEILEYLREKIHKVKEIQNKNLSNLNLASADLSHAILENVNLTGTNLADTYLNTVFFKNVNLGGANLSRANFGGLNFGDIILINEELQKLAILKGTIFFYVNSFQTIENLKNLGGDRVLRNIQSCIQKNLPLDHGPDKPLIKEIIQQFINNFKTAIATIDNEETAATILSCLEAVNATLAKQLEDEKLGSLSLSNYVSHEIEILITALKNKKEEEEAKVSKIRCNIM